MAVASKKKRKGKRKKVEVDVKELDGILDQAVEKPLSQAEADKLRLAIHTMAEHILAERRSSEKLDKMTDEVSDKDSDGKPKEESLPPRPPRSDKGPGRNGRNGADAYTAATRVSIDLHAALKPGCNCPSCLKGKLSRKKPRTLVRIKGMAPLTATVYERECVRCNLCGEVFTAEAPAEVGSEKYDESVASMIAILKFGYGIPYDRLARMQKVLGIPMPASTQYEILEERANPLKPIHKELLRRVAQASVIHTDDTSMKILKVKRDPKDKRTGLFTTGIVGVASDHKIGLFFTGTKHSGENLAAVLEERAAELESPVVMCDALSWNTSKLKAPDAIVLAHCLAHGRRRFTDIAANFPEACLYVLGELAKVYHHDQITREQKMGPTERLKYHKQHSRPIMTALREWIDLQLEGTDEIPPTYEPNSALGQALGYLKKHWQPLTLFLRDGKAPIDNNICERAIKKAVLNRKNAMFYRTLNGAQIGDLCMSIIHTCELNGVNPFDYLVALGQQTAEELSSNAAAWMPWNYKCRQEAAAAPRPTVVEK